MFSSILSPGAIISTWQMKNQSLSIMKGFAVGHAGMSVADLELNPKLSGSQFCAIQCKAGKPQANTSKRWEWEKKFQKSKCQKPL